MTLYERNAPKYGARECYMQFPVGKLFDRVSAWSQWGGQGRAEQVRKWKKKGQKDKKTIRDMLSVKFILERNDL